MQVYVLYYSRSTHWGPETEIVGVYSTEQACLDAKDTLYAEDPNFFKENGGLCYHETQLED